MYDPQSGRFTSRDPLPGAASEPQRQDPYAYALSNPLRYYDLDGRFAAAIGVEVGAGVLAGTLAAYAYCQMDPGSQLSLEDAANNAVDQVRDGVNAISHIGKDPGGSGGGQGGENGGSQADPIRDLLGNLERGTGKNVWLVDSEETLESTYEKLAQGGKPVRWQGYNGKVVERPDGTQVGLRNESTSGGKTIDIRWPNDENAKIHVKAP